MAIKIVGKDKQAVKTTTCKNCASILEYTHADTQREVRRDYGGGSDTYRFLTCPRCGETVNVPLH
jgi:RNase P subunit RPR2